jgi:ABC-type multidrug transport system ATPase subunit
VGRPDARAAAAHVADTVGLSRQAKVAQRRLSAGQQRRLALGVALVRDARLLLLDEPHAGLDADGRDLLEALVHRAADEGRTVVFSSHELDRARALAHREVRMRAGEAASIETMPVETMPIETTPIETTPNETMPNETAPIETGPIETGPIRPHPIRTGP